MTTTTRATSPEKNREREEKQITIFQPVEQETEQARPTTTKAKSRTQKKTFQKKKMRIRLRESANGVAYKYTGFISSLRMIAKEEGIRGLYGGMGIHTLRSVPNAAIMFLAFELSSKWLTDSSIAK